MDTQQGVPLLRQHLTAGGKSTAQGIPTHGHRCRQPSRDAVFEHHVIHLAQAVGVAVARVNAAVAVDVQIDEPRHHVAAAGIDDGGVGRDILGMYDAANDVVFIQ